VQEVKKMRGKLFDTDAESSNIQLKVGHLPLAGSFILKHKLKPVVDYKAYLQ
jgi:hypothetical protein